MNDNSNKTVSIKKDKQRKLIYQSPGSGFSVQIKKKVNYACTNHLLLICCHLLNTDGKNFINTLFSLSQNLLRDSKKEWHWLYKQTKSEQHPPFSTTTAQCGQKYNQIWVDLFMKYSFIFVAKLIFFSVAWVRWIRSLWVSFLLLARLSPANNIIIYA